MRFGEAGVGTLPRASGAVLDPQSSSHAQPRKPSSDPNSAARSCASSVACPEGYNRGYGSRLGFEVRVRG